MNKRVAELAGPESLAATGLESLAAGRLESLAATDSSSQRWLPW